MRTKIIFSLAALAFVFSACNKDLLQDEADEATGVKAAITLPGTITPFEDMAGTAVDAKAFDKFGKPFDPRDEGKPLYVVDGIFFVKTKPTGEKNAKMANFLVFEENPTPGTLTVQTKINGNKCFSYVFDAELFARQAFRVDNGTSVRYEFTPKAETGGGSVSGRIPDGLDNVTGVYLYGKQPPPSSFMRVKAGILDDYPYLYGEFFPDDDGIFTFDGVPPGEYIVKIDTPDGEYVSSPITVSEGTTLIDIETTDFTPVIPDVVITNIQTSIRIITDPEGDLHVYKFEIDFANYAAGVVFRYHLGLYNDDPWIERSTDNHSGIDEFNSDGTGRIVVEIFYYGGTLCGERPFTIEAYKNGVKVMNAVTYMYDLCDGYTVTSPFAGSGTSGNPYLIGTAAELTILADLVNDASTNSIWGDNYYKLTDNIDLSAYHSGTGWIPIGTIYYPFRGVFDGNDKVVSNMYINKTTHPDAYVDLGLFGFANSATIKNLGVTNVNISAAIVSAENIAAGGVVSSLHYGHLSRCYVTGSISTSAYGNTSAGGVVNTLLTFRTSSQCLSIPIIHENIIVLFCSITAC